MRRRAFLLSVPLLGLAQALGCTDPRSHSHAVYLLVDTSGTYAPSVAIGRSTTVNSSFE